MKQVMIGAFVVGAAMIGMTANAQARIDVGNPQGGDGYEVSGGVITIIANGEYVLTGSTAENRVVVGAGVNATITMENVSIMSNTNSPFSLDAAGCEIVLKLEGNNSLTSTVPDTEGEDRFSAAVQVEGTSSVTIEGSGSLVANGSVGAAGIGGGYAEHADGSTTVMTVGTINIKGGNITATGGYQGAGIGSGANSVSGVVNISGGNINTTGAYDGAGIGGGSHSEGGIINISGGNISAAGGGYAAAIGSGGAGGSGGSINISGGVIFAKSIGGSKDPAAIGGGSDSGAGNVTISGGSIFAWGDTGPGIGAGAGGSGGSINISGGNIITDEIGIGAGNSTPTSISDGAIIADTINTASFGNAKILTGVNVTKDFVTKMFANAPKGARDTVIIEVPGEGENTYIHDTVRDTIEVPGSEEGEIITVIRRDTVRIEIPGPTVYDTVRLTLRDTFAIIHTVYDTLHLTRERHDTTVREVYVVIDPSSGAEFVVDDAGDVFLVAMPADDYGADMFWLHGIAQNTPFAIYYTSGALVLKAARNPICLTESGMFIVAQGGKYWKVVR